MIKNFQNDWLKCLPKPFPRKYSLKNKFPKKGVNFVYISINYCVYHKCRGYKTRTLVHVVFKLIFGNVYFVLVISSIHGQKMRFPASSQSSISKNQFLVTLRSFVSTYDIFEGGSGYFPLVRPKRSFFTKR